MLRELARETDYFRLSIRILTSVQQIDQKTGTDGVRSAEISTLG